jgi:hypothetical protein
MPYKNPYRARMAKALRHAPGNLEELKRRTFATLVLSFDEISLCDSSEERRKWVLAFGQIAGTYLKIYETGELEPRLQALEHLMEQNHGQKP